MNSVIHNARRFLSVYSSLLINLFRFSFWWASAIVGFQVLASVLQPLIILVLSKGVKVIQGKELPDSSPLSSLLNDRDPVVILAYLSALVLLIGVAGAVFGWLGSSGARKLGRFYRLDLTERLLHRIADSPLGAIALPGPLADEKNLHKVAVSYGLKLNLAIICLFTAVRHLVSTLVLTVSLFFVNAQLALYFFLALPVLLPLYYLLHKKTHRASTQWFEEGGARQTASSLMGLGSIANQLPKSRAEDKPVDFADEFRASNETLDHLETMEFGRLSGARSQLYSQTFRALFLGGALFLFGLIALRPGDLSWETLIVFLVAASMLQQSSTNLFSSLSTLVWHAPPVTAIDSYAKAVLAEEIGRKRGGKITVKGESLSPEAAREVQSILVVSPVEIGRTSFHYIMKALASIGLVDGDPEEIDYQSISLRNLSGKKRLNYLKELKSCSGISFLEMGGKNRDEKMNDIRAAGLGRVAVFVDGWEDELNCFDCIVMIGEDGTVELGNVEYWKDRDDLVGKKSGGGGVDLDFDEMM